MFFARHCPICGSTHRSICPGCLASVDQQSVVTLDGFGRVATVMTYDDVSARLILAAKNGGRRDLLRWAGGHLAESARSSFDVSTMDAVTWVPAHPEQQRTRGFDQGELIARATARRLGLPCRAMLRRRGGATRKGLSRVDRLEGPSLSPRTPKIRTTDHCVLMVDDVMTTGSSLQRGADALRSAGVSNILSAVVAASPRFPTGLSARNRSTIYIGRTSDVRSRATSTQ